MYRQAARLARRFLGIRSETDFYSQGGEDAIISNTFLYVVGIDRGFFLDIGAYHPYKHSNTYLLYKSGWRGMNVDPRPGSKALFDRFRRDDINIEAGVADHDGSMTYYVIDNDSTMNTFSRENLERLGMIDKVERTVKVPVYSVSTLLSQYPQVRRIDYLNVDAEGFELEILSGFDKVDLWPTVISIEQNGVFSLDQVMVSVTHDFLKKRGYEVFAKNVLLKDVATIFYIRRELAVG